MDVQKKLDEIVATVGNARSMPMSASCVVNRAELLALLDEVRRALPGSLEQARELLGDREGMVAGARAEAERIIDAAHRERGSLIADTEVARRSRQEADRILDDARREAGEVRAEADDYVDSKLANFEVVLTKTLGSVGRGREKLLGTGTGPGPDGREDPDYAEAPERSPDPETQRRRADQYVDAKLGAFEAVLAKTLEAVGRGRQKLHGRVAEDELGLLADGTDAPRPTSDADYLADLAGLAPGAPAVPPPPRPAPPLPTEPAAARTPSPAGDGYGTDGPYGQDGPSERDGAYAPAGDGYGRNDVHARDGVHAQGAGHRRDDVHGPADGYHRDGPADGPAGTYVHGRASTYGRDGMYVRDDVYGPPGDAGRPVAAAPHDPRTVYGHQDPYGYPTPGYPDPYPSAGNRDDGHGTGRSPSTGTPLETPDGPGAAPDGHGGPGRHGGPVVGHGGPPPLPAPRPAALDEASLFDTGMITPDQLRRYEQGR